MNKVKCINAEGYSSLTLNKVYEVTKVRNGYIEVKTDDNYNGWFRSDRFEVIKDMTVIKKIKCINNTGLGEDYLNNNEVYDIAGENDGHYQISGSRRWWDKTRFEDVVEETINKKVVVVDARNSLHLTLGKEYEVVEETTHSYKVLNNANVRTYYVKSHFEIESATPEFNLMPSIRGGNIVELKDGTRGLVVTLPNKTMHVYWFKNLPSVVNSSCTKLPRQVNIKKIYDGITDEHPAAGLSFNIYGSQTLIWEYKEPMVEVTLEQIAEKFNTTPDKLSIKGYE